MDKEDVITNGVDQVGGQKDTSFNLHKSELHNGGQNKTIGNATVVQRSARDKKGSADKSSPRRHECKECGKAFKFKKCLDTHLKVHAGLKPEKPYSCGICGMKFFSKNVLQKHTRNKHPDEFPCRKCGKIFNVEDEMKIHTLSHSKIKPFQCGFCNEGYSECSGLLKHLLSHTVDSSPSRRSNPKHKIKKIVTRTRSRRKVSSRLKSNSSLSIKHENEESENSENENTSPDDSDYAPEYETSDQDKKYDVQPQELKNSASTRLRNGTIDEIDTIIKDKVQLLLSRNVKVDLKKERIVCEVCGKDYSVRGYQNHVRTHSGNRKLKEIPKFCCHQCDKWFTQKHALRKHYQRHLGRRYKCEYCNKSYCDSYNLTYHMKIHTGGAKFSCSYCDRLFCSKSQLSYHITVHTGVKAFTCEICGRDFRLKTMLKTHIKTHTQDRPYMCDICGRKFLFMASLRKHSMVHTGEKPHGCSICGKTFAAKVSLAQHMNIHTGEGYPCPLCGRQFAQLANLTRHKRIHTGSRPYPCTLCDKTFRTSNDKKRHMRIHTGDKPYHCDICGKGFTQSGNLQTHMKVHNKGADNRSHNTSMNSMAVNTQNIPQHQINNTL